MSMKTKALAGRFLQTFVQRVRARERREVCVAQGGKGRGQCASLLRSHITF